MGGIKEKTQLKTHHQTLGIFFYLIVEAANQKSTKNPIDVNAKLLSIHQSPATAPHKALSRQNKRATMNFLSVKCWAGCMR